jgi:hypothetical protein
VGNTLVPPVFVGCLHDIVADMAVLRFSGCNDEMFIRDSVLRKRLVSRSTTCQVVCVWLESRVVRLKGRYYKLLSTMRDDARFIQRCG